MQSIEEIVLNIHQNLMLEMFRLLIFFIGGV